MPVCNIANRRLRIGMFYLQKSVFEKIELEDYKLLYLQAIRIFLFSNYNHLQFYLFYKKDTDYYAAFSAKYGSDNN